MEDTKRKFIAKNKEISKTKALEAIFAFLFGAFCAKANLPYGLMPFGIAVCCEAKMEKQVSAGLVLGALISYTVFTLQPVYIAAVLLTIPLKIIVKYFVPRKKERLIPLITAFITLLFLYATLYIQYGFLNFDLVTGAFGLILGLVFTGVFKDALKIIFTPQKVYGKLSFKEVISLILFTGLLLTGFTEYEFFKIAPVRILGVALILFFCYYTNFGIGASAIIATFCFLYKGELALLLPAYSISALTASLFSPKKKYFSLVLYLGVFSVFALYFSKNFEALAAICETGLGAFLYFLLPVNFTDNLAKRLLLTGQNFSAQERKYKELLEQKLKEASKSLEDISRALTKEEQMEDKSIYRKMEDIQERICKNCRRNLKCWGNEYDTTKDVFNKTANVILKKLKFDEADMPIYFINTCIKTEKIFEEIKKLCNESKYEIMTQRAALANRKIIAAQYEGIGAFIKDICSEINAITHIDEDTAEKVREYFYLQGAQEQDISVYYDRDKAIHIEAKFKTPRRFFERKVSTELSDLLNKNIVCDYSAVEEGFVVMKFIQKERYSLTVAQTNRSKDGERVCGDSFASFKSKSYRQILALSDGMGSGFDADRLSNLTLDILKNLLENGFEEEKACSLINSTLLLGGDGQSFSTLDMASINLFNGRADFYKLGAAPTLILREGKAYEIFCASLPAGIMGESRAEHKNCKLRDGDMIIMLSDGVDIDENILNICKENAKESPITLCERIMERATVSGKADDDMTVAVARVNIKKNAA